VIAITRYNRKMARHVIYVPGLGDHRTYGQPIILKWWRLFGVKAHYHAIGWQSDEPFDMKLSRLVGLVDSLYEKYGSVSMVGVSAGASAVLNAFAERKNISSIVCICGKINNPQAVGKIVYDKNPPFKTSLALLQKNLTRLSNPERSRIMSIHPLDDKTVPPKDTLIKGALEITIPTKGHIFSIYYSLMFKTLTFCKFLRNT
jgi:hypothetical protein